MKNFISFISILFCSIFFSNSSTAQNVYVPLKVLDPNSPSTKLPANFDSVKITVNPSGGFANVDIEIDVSAKNSYWASTNDSVEFEYKFNLPQGSHIHAAWLWMFGMPVEAKLYERSIAESIYEGLVGRRIDPLIIYKHKDGSYEARIYPAVGSESRKFKISVLIPIKANNKGIELPLPLSMLTSGSNIYPTVKLIVHNNTFWQESFPLSNSVRVDSANTSTITFEATPSIIKRNSYLYFPNYTRGNYYIQDFENNQDGYYQLMLQQPDQYKAGHYLFVIDHSNRGTNSDEITQLLPFLKTKLLYELTELDSFNVIYTRNNQVHYASQGWLAADSSQIESVFADFPTNFQTTNNLTTTSVQRAIDFNNGQSNKGKILLLTNNKSDVSNVSTLDTRLNTILASMPLPYYSFNIIHYGTTSQQPDFWHVNRYYFNNEYFLGRLASFTGGMYVNHHKSYFDNSNGQNVTNYVPITDALQSAFDYIQPKYIFDHLDFDYGGFLVDEYVLPSPYSNSPKRCYIETGRFFNASGSLSISRNFKIDSSLHQLTIIPVHEQDTLGVCRKAWAGSYLTEMVSLNTNGLLTYEIVNKSIEYNVLTLNTAFLALEPDSIVLVTGTGNNPVLVNMSELNKTAHTIKAIPNPFSNSQMINIESDFLKINTEWHFEVMDMQGRIVYSTKGLVEKERNIQINWNGVSLNAGIYYAKVLVGNEIMRIKLVKK